jgi:hypothetical protein
MIGSSIGNVVCVEICHKIEVATTQIGQWHNALFRPELVRDASVQTRDG